MKCDTGQPTHANHAFSFRKRVVRGWGIGVVLMDGHFRPAAWEEQMRIGAAAIAALLLVASPAEAADDAPKRAKAP